MSQLCRNALVHLAILCLGLVGACAWTAEAIAWTSISYPGQQPHIAITNTENGPRLNISEAVAAGAQPQIEVLAVSGWVTRDRPLAFTLEFSGAGFGNQLFTEYSSSYAFPGTLAGEDLVILVKTATVTYALDVPYGLLGWTPMASFDAKKMAGVVPAECRYLKWESVTLATRTLANGWGVTPILRNPFDGEVEIVLSRNDTAVGKSSWLWNLDEPKVSVVIREGDQELSSLNLSRRLREGGFDRCDVFKLNRWPTDEKMDRGIMKVGIDEVRLEFVVPRSLYGYTHGHEDDFLYK